MRSRVKKYVFVHGEEDCKDSLRKVYGGVSMQLENFAIATVSRASWQPAHGNKTRLLDISQFSTDFFQLDQFEQPFLGFRFFPHNKASNSDSLIFNLSSIKYLF